MLQKYLSVQVNCIGANTVQGTVQEGAELELACPAGSSITSIIFASYGTPNNYVQGSCEAATSLEVVTESCVGQPSCQVAASDDVFGDPCPETVIKSLSVQAECSAGLAPGIIQATATDGGAVVLSCQQGETISNIGFASYGTPTNYESSSWCDAPSSETVVAAACIGKSYCSVEASTSVFGDPCPDTAKHLNVQAHVGEGSSAA
uniref:SUEL-type lectin domain-containing protein n=1 Tax=Hucho hucho TaxID=62062 RepID=A0A4W5LMS5_9TELE